MAHTTIMLEGRSLLGAEHTCSISPPYVFSPIAGQIVFMLHRALKVRDSLLDMLEEARRGATTRGFVIHLVFRIAVLRTILLPDHQHDVSIIIAIRTLVWRRSSSLQI